MSIAISAISSCLFYTQVSNFKGLRQYCFVRRLRSKKPRRMSRLSFHSSIDLHASRSTTPTFQHITSHTRVLNLPFNYESCRQTALQHRYYLPTVLLPARSASTTTYCTCRIGKLPHNTDSISQQPQSTAPTCRCPLSQCSLSSPTP